MLKVFWRLLLGVAETNHQQKQKFFTQKELPQNTQIFHVDIYEFAAILRWIPQKFYQL